MPAPNIYRSQCTSADLSLLASREALRLPPARCASRDHFLSPLPQTIDKVGPARPDPIRTHVDLHLVAGGGNNPTVDLRRRRGPTLSGSGSPGALGHLGRGRGDVAVGSFAMHHRSARPFRAIASLIIRPPPGRLHVFLIVGGKF